MPVQQLHQAEYDWRRLHWSIAINALRVAAQKTERAEKTGPILLVILIGERYANLLGLTLITSRVNVLFIFFACRHELINGDLPREPSRCLAERQRASSIKLNPWLILWLNQNLYWGVAIFP